MFILQSSSEISRLRMNKRHSDRTLINVSFTGQSKICFIARLYVECAFVVVYNIFFQGVAII